MYGSFFVPVPNRPHTGGSSKMNTILKRLHSLRDDDLLSLSEAIDAEVERRLAIGEAIPESGAVGPSCAGRVIVTTRARPRPRFGQSALATARHRAA